MDLRSHHSSWSSCVIKTRTMYLMPIVMSAGGDDFQRLLRQLETIDHKHKVRVWACNLTYGVLLLTLDRWSGPCCC